MPKYSDTQNVDITVRLVGTKYEIEKVKGLDLDFDNTKNGVHCGGSWFIHFAIMNKDGAAYTFPKKEDAFWVEVGNGSNPPKHQQLPYCMATWVSHDGLELLVRNDNPSPATLKYTLNLVSTTSTPANLPLDPIMSNQNGGITYTPWFASEVGPVALAAGLFAGAALIGAALLGRERD